MNIQINGEMREVTAYTLADLIQELRLNGRFVIERNRTLIPKSQWAETLLQENDCIEIIQAVGGG